MSYEKVTIGSEFKQKMFWGYFSQLMQFGAGLLILPAVLRNLSPAELGIWYVYMAFVSLSVLLEMGLTPTISRNVSYILGGARELKVNGVDQAVDRDSVDLDLIRQLFQTSKKIYKIISIVLGLLLVIPGFAYVIKIAGNDIEFGRLTFSWFIFVFALVVGMYYKYFTPFLMGMGKMVEYYKSNSLPNIVLIVVTYIAMLVTDGLTAVSFGFLSSTIVSRALGVLYLKKNSQLYVPTHNNVESFRKDGLTHVLFASSWKIGLTSIGAFLIVKGNTLISSYYVGIIETASYALTLQLFFVLQSVSLVLFNIYLPELSKCRIRNNYKLFSSILRRSLFVAIGTYVAGMLLIVVVGNHLLKVVGSRTELLDSSILILVGIMLLLELIHSAAAGAIITGNNIPFVKSSLFSGISIIALSLIGVNYFQMGIAWLVISQFFVQLCYNNWRWPLLIYRELKFRDV